MKTCKKPNFPITKSSDIALLLGLSSKAGLAEIATAFGRATGREASLEVVEKHITSSGPETWEVRIIHDLPRCRLELRRGGRGQWVASSSDIPEDVLKFLVAKEDRAGRLVTARSWKAWQRADWIRASGRRRRSGAKEIIAIIEIGEVRRRTGEVQISLVISALGAPYPELLQPIQLDLPVRASQVMGVVEMLKESSQSQVDMTA